MAGIPLLVFRSYAPKTDKFVFFFFTWTVAVMEPEGVLQQHNWIVIPDEQRVWHLHCPNSLSSWWLSPLYTDLWHQQPPSAPHAEIPPPLRKRRGGGGWNALSGTVNIGEGSQTSLRCLCFLLSGVFCCLQLAAFPGMCRDAVVAQRGGCCL